jgi:hypothetical protein
LGVSRELLVRHEDSSRTQRKEKVSRWKSLPEDWRRKLRATVNCMVYEIAIEPVACSYELQNFNKCNYQSKFCLHGTI